MADKTLTLGTTFTSNIKPVLNAIRKLQGEMQALNNGLNSFGSKAAATSKKVSSMTTQLSKATAGTKKLGDTQAWTGKQIGKVTGAWDKLKSAMKVTASYGLASMAIYGIYQALQSGVAEIINFDQGLKNLQAISGATAAQVSVMGDAIKRVAKETKFSTVEVADGMVLLTQAGFSATEAMAAIHAVSMLATGTLASLQVTSDLLTTTIRAFSLEATEASRVADVMANAINKSKLTIDKLRISFNFVGSVAAQTGLSLEQTAASMMVLANSGLRASTIGTGLRQVLARLMAPTGKLREAFEQHNIELSKVNPRLVGFQTAIKNLLPVMWDGEKGTVNMTKAFELFGLRGSQAAAILVKSFSGTEYSDMLEKVYEVGAAEAMAGIQAEGLGVKLKNLADRFKLVAIAAGEAGVSHAIGYLVDVLRDAAGLMEAFAQNIIGATLVAWGAWSLAIVGVIKSFKILYSAMKSVAIWTGLRAMVATLTMTFTGLQTSMLIATQTSISMTRALWMSLTAMIANMSVVGKFVLVLGIAATAIGFLSGRTKKYIEQLAKTVETNNAAVDSIRQYADSLDSLNEKLQRGEDVTAQYTATIERLKKDHEDLALYVDFNTASYEDLVEGMAAMQWDKFNAGLDDSTELVIKQAEHVEWLRKEYANMDTDIGLGLGGMNKALIENKRVSEETFEQWALGRKALTELANIQQGYIAQLIYFTKTGKLSADEARELIKTYFEMHGAADKVAGAVDRLNKALEKSVEIKPIVNLKDITKAYEDYYNTLNLLGQAHLVQETSSSMLAQKHLEASLQKKIGSHKDAWRIIGALIGESQAKVLMSQIDTNEKDKKSASELVEFKKAELEKYIDAVEVSYGAGVAAEKSSYEKSIAAIKAASSKKLAYEKLTVIQRNNIITQALAKEEETTEKHLKELEDMQQKHEGRMVGIRSITAGLDAEEKDANITRLNDIKKQADMEITAEFNKAKKKLDIKKLAAVEDEAATEAINRKISELELKFMEKSLVNHRKYYDDLKKLKGESDTDVLMVSYKLIAEEEKIAAKRTSIRVADEKARAAARKKDFEDRAKRLNDIKKQADLEIDIEEHTARMALEARKRAAIGDKEALEAIKKEEQELDTKFMEQRIENNEKYYKQLRSLNGMFHANTINAKRKWMSDQEKLSKKRTAQDIEEEERRIAKLKEVLEKEIAIRDEVEKEIDAQLSMASTALGPRKRAALGDDAETKALIKRENELQLKALEDKFKNEQEYFEKIFKLYGEQEQIVKDSYRKLIDLDEAVQDKRTAIAVQGQKERDDLLKEYFGEADTINRQAELSIAAELNKNRTLLEIKKQSVIENKTATDAINKEIRELELRAMEESLKNHQKYYDSLKLRKKKSDSELIDAENKLMAMQDAIDLKKIDNAAQTEREITANTKKYIEERAKLASLRLTDEENQAKAALEAKKQAAIGNIDATIEINRLERETELKFMKKRLAAKVKEAEELLKIKSKHNLEYIAKCVEIGALEEAVASKTTANLVKIEEEKAAKIKRIIDRDKGAIDAIKKQADLEVAAELNKSRLILEAKKQAAVGNLDAMAAINKEERDLELASMEKSLENTRKYIEELKQIKGISHIEILAAEVRFGAEQEAVAEKTTANMLADKRDKLEQEKRAFEESLTATRLYSDEWVAIIEEMYKRGLSDTSEYITQMKAYLEHLEYLWKHGIIAVDEYTEAVRLALEKGVIDQEEADARKVASTRTFWEALKYGLSQNVADWLTWQEIVIAVGETFINSFVGGATNALWGFIDGTKSAAQAFQDFARSMLRDIIRMIIKLMILKALQAMTGMGGGLAQYGTVSSGGTGGIGMHTGGIVGATPQPVRIVNPNVFANAKHYDRGGLVGGEVPIIAHRGEGVFTPEQMAAMGGGGATTVELTNVNIVDDRALSQLLASSRGKSAMLNFLGENSNMIRKVLGRR